MIDHLLPYDYPVEIAAKKLRQKYAQKDIAIYSLCECVGKLTLAKQPFGNEDSNIDYALSVSQMFPRINQFKNDSQEELEINEYGVKVLLVIFMEIKDFQQSVLKDYHKLEKPWI